MRTAASSLSRCSLFCFGEVTLVSGELNGDVAEPDDLLHRGGHGGRPAGLDPATAGPLGGLLHGRGVPRPPPAPGTTPCCRWPPAALRRCAATAGRPSRRTGPGTRRVPVRRGCSVDGSSSAGASWAAASRAAIAGQGFLLRHDIGLGPASDAASRSLSPTALRRTEFRWPSRSATAASRASDSCSLSRAASARVLRLGAPGLGGGQREAALLQCGRDGLQP